MLKNILVSLSNLFSTKGEYYIYSPNEAACNDGRGYYNKEKNDWVDEEEATLYDDITYEIPRSTGGDARFIMKDPY